MIVRLSFRYESTHGRFDMTTVLRFEMMKTLS